MRICSKLSFPLLAALGLLSVSAQGQSIDPVPLKNWAAPMSWLPTTETELAETRARAVTQNRLSLLVQPVTSTASVNTLVAITPCRLVDTRSNMPVPYGSGTPTPLAWLSGTTHSIVASGLVAGTYPTVPNPCVGLPAAEAYSARITVWPQPAGTAIRWLSVCPTGAANCSSTSAVTGYQGNTSGPLGALGVIVSNGTVIPVNAADSFDVFVTDETWVIIDVNGYYAPPGDSNNNLAVGGGALANNTTGMDNTAVGERALQQNTTGNNNTAFGDVALLNNTTGAQNTALGTSALTANTTGFSNTALGGATLEINTTGSANTATGFGALQFSFTGSQNTANGYLALNASTVSSFNTAIGDNALSAANAAGTAGDRNTAVGSSSLAHITTGLGNTAVGANTLFALTSGDRNIAIGNSALATMPTGTDNIAIGAAGPITAETGVIRIGQAPTHTAFFAAGITGVTPGQPSPVAVVIDSNGQLGTVVSSRRFKEDIEDMGDASDGLFRLRPVTFRYKQPYADGSKPLDYGLIAEEVAEVYPDLAVKGADGEIETVQYQKLNTLLLNEVQKQHKRIAEQEEELAALKARLSDLEKLIEKSVTAAAKQ